MNTQHEQEAVGEKYTSPALPSGKEALTIALDVVGAYKKLIASDEAEFPALIYSLSNIFGDLVRVKEK